METYFARRYDFALNLSDLVLSLHVVPVLGTGQHWVASEHSHSEERGLGDLIGGKGTSNNLELSHLQQNG
jgi:hypothetical protein